MDIRVGLAGDIAFEEIVAFKVERGFEEGVAFEQLAVFDVVFTTEFIAQVSAVDVASISNLHLCKS